MADYDLKVIAPDTGFTTGNFLFGADNQGAATPVPYTADGIKTFMSASPTLVTPVIGAATGTSLALSGALTAATFNGLTITTTSGGVLTIPNSVTLTGPAASGTAMTLGNAEAVSGIKTFATGQIVNGTLRLGTISATTGQLLLANSASANLTTIQAGNAAAAVTYTWPTNVGSAGQQLTDAAGDGVLSWAAAGSGGSGSPGGSDTQVQFNDGGAFGGDADLTWNKTNNVLAINGVGRSIITTSIAGSPRVQIGVYQADTTYAGGWFGNVTASDTNYSFIGNNTELIFNSTALLSFRFADSAVFDIKSDATIKMAGTYVLGWTAGSAVVGLDTKLSRLSAGAVQIDGPGANSGKLVVTGNGEASFSAVTLNGAWFSGGSATTTKPQLLVEASGATSTGWSTAGTGLGVNATSGFTGRLFDAQLAGVSQMNVSSAGVVTVAAATATPAAGSTAARLLFGTTAGFGIYYGSGAPTVSAAQGSIYLRSDGGGIADRLYVNTNGSTTWTNFVSAA